MVGQAKRDKMGQSRLVGWSKKGRPIFQPIIGGTSFSNIPTLKLFSTKL